MLPLKALELAIAILHSNPALKIARLEWQHCRKHLAERQEVVDNNDLDQETRFKMSNCRSCLWDWQDEKQHGQRSHREVQQDDSLNWGNRMTCHWQTIQNMIEKIDVRLLGWAKTNQSCWIDLFLFFTHFCVEFSTFDKVTFSDEVRMSSLIASITMSHSAFKSHAPTELANWCFMLHNTQNWSRLSFSWLSIHIVNYHRLPSLFSEASTELIRGHPIIHRAIPPWSCGIFTCWLWGWIF